MDFRSFSDLNSSEKRRLSDNGKMKETKASSSFDKNSYRNRGYDFSGDINVNGAEEIQQKINGLKGKSEKELMNAMLGEASRLKGEGKFNANELEEAFVKAKDFLTPDQLAKMRGLIDMLK